MLKNQAIVAVLLAITVCGTSAGAESRYWAQTFELSPAAFKLPAQLSKDVPPQYAALLSQLSLKGTLRYRLGISIGGSAIRVRFSNEGQDTPLHIAGASVALATGVMDGIAGSMKRLTFGGRPDIVIPPGAPVISDAVDFDASALSDLIVSVDAPEGFTGSPMGGTMFQVESGDVMSSVLTNARPARGRPIITGVFVATRKPTGVIVALGDSITDGYRTDPAVPRGWVDAFARRLQQQRGGLVHGVISAGINGNRILAAGAGDAALARADRDVFSVPGLSHIIVLEGINDIGSSGGGSPLGNSGPVSAEDLIAGLSQLAVRAHVRGVKIYAGTILPFAGANYFSRDKEKIRLAVNEWIRTSRVMDGSIDFELAVRDQARPDTLDARFDSGDHLHPSDAGYRAMADAIPIRYFH